VRGSSLGWRKFAATAVVVGGLVGGGVWAAGLFSNGPGKFAINESTSTGGSTGVPDLGGTWAADTTSEAGYRVEKVLLGKTVEVVGRGPLKSGVISIESGEVVSGRFVVELGSLRTDNPQRDSAFKGRIMEVSTWPEAVFVLKKPISLRSDMRVGEVISGEFEGELSMRGLTRGVVFAYQAAYEVDGSISMVASYEASFADWGIKNPSQPGVIVKESAELEVSVRLIRE